MQNVSCLVHSRGLGHSEEQLSYLLRVARRKPTEMTTRARNAEEVMYQSIMPRIHSEISRYMNRVERVFFRSELPARLAEAQNEARKTSLLEYDTHLHKFGQLLSLMWEELRRFKDLHGPDWGRAFRVDTPSFFQNVEDSFYVEFERRLLSDLAGRITELRWDLEQHVLGEFEKRVAEEVRTQCLSPFIRNLTFKVARM